MHCYVQSGHVARGTQLINPDVSLLTTVVLRVGWEAGRWLFPQPAVMHINVWRTGANAGNGGDRPDRTTRLCISFDFTRNTLGHSSPGEKGPLEFRPAGWRRRELLV